MAQWYANELAKLSHVSVRTLHHYDRIGLLKPSVRQGNGYRLYSEADLLKLQQIIALKFFGFSLSQIQALLSTRVDMMEHFKVQSQLLQKKAEAFAEASRTLNGIISGWGDNTSIPWKTVIETIEVYRMTQELENSWVGKVLSEDELKEYAKFEHGLKSRFTPAEKKNFENDWAALVGQIGTNLNKDPTGDFGDQIAARCMGMINGLYGKEHAGLRQAIWEKGFMRGQMDPEHALSPEIVAWLDKAIDAHYRNRIHSVLSQVGTRTPDAVRKQWEQLLTEMYGDAQDPKKALVEVALKDNQVTAAAKSWLRTTLAT